MRRAALVAGAGLVIVAFGAATRVADTREGLIAEVVTLLAGLTPGSTGGSLIRNSAGTAGLYSRSRGHGADDMLLTNAGLWIASDNFGGNTQCGGLSGYAGICFLPYPA